LPVLESVHTHSLRAFADLVRTEGDFIAGKTSAANAWLVAGTREGDIANAAFVLYNG
jgi:hypothetical protein